MNPALAEVVNRELTLEEARAYLDHTVTPAEREGVLDVVRWFTRRYRTPLERLAYVRRASARWSRTVGRRGSSDTVTSGS